ncbi:hypothetical protein VIGAN_03245500 [Vigna angularis var. angularis]|uniref:Transmembrane protein n=1 Tax=Vigna angularis var. angularis TaxID=157739 RepID=A0A0S3RPA6_PHAAN|nr:hypothetical protein VIGAN_03245500 [Vigna angularis var. angularis]
MTLSDSMYRKSDIERERERRSFVSPNMVLVPVYFMVFIPFFFLLLSSLRTISSSSLSLDSSSGVCFSSLCPYLSDRGCW